MYSRLDDTEVSLRTAVKARQAAEAEAADASAALEESVRGRREAEARAAQAQREGATTAAQLEEAEEEAAEVGEWLNFMMIIAVINVWWSDYEVF